MNHISKSPLSPPNMQRRKFLEGLVAGGIVMTCAPLGSAVAAMADMKYAPVLSGTEGRTGDVEQHTGDRQRGRTDRVDGRRDVQRHVAHR